MLIKCTHISCYLKIGCKVDQIYADSKNLATRDVPNHGRIQSCNFEYLGYHISGKLMRSDECHMMTNFDYNVLGMVKPYRS